MKKYVGMEKYIEEECIRKYVERKEFVMFA